WGTFLSEDLKDRLYLPFDSRVRDDEDT
ncbi:MAG: hypothetical protein QG649_482, partial [Patescibacteria group bacterium]|nr:hypothetical protein [Patescibacteria group bacterium]